MAFYTGDLFPQWKGNLFIGALKFKDVRRLMMKGDRIVGEEVLLSNLNERIRDIRQGPDGALYILTDHAKGRILKLAPKA
jgi:glucose/arabinose dehydrogenase